MESNETAKVEVKTTVELDVARNAKNNNTVPFQKPVCKDGVCTLTWKPVKPAAAA